ncbi:MAG TPA: hypothetical protein VJM83_02985, partial [Nitrospirota bacterium]|nr:hypothetical protein [Nitrospirota bacterium]
MPKGTHSYHLDKYSAYRWISGVVRIIPEPLANFIGDRVADWLFLNKSGNIVEEQIRNLDHVLGGVPKEEKRKIINKLWRRHGRFLVDLFRFERMSDAQIRGRVSEFVGVEHIKKALEQGR